eukprot:Gb_17260 [translate_table: standard]
MNSIQYLLLQQVKLSFCQHFKDMFVILVLRWRMVVEFASLQSGLCWAHFLLILLESVSNGALKILGGWLQKLEFRFHQFQLLLLASSQWLGLYSPPLHVLMVRDGRLDQIP